MGQYKVARFLLTLSCLSLQIHQQLLPENYERKLAYSSQRTVTRPANDANDLGQQTADISARAVLEPYIKLRRQRQHPAPPNSNRTTPSTNPILAANLIHQFYSPILQPIHPHPQPSPPTHHAPRHRPHFLRWSLHRRQMPHLRRQSPKVSKSMLHLYFRPSFLQLPSPLRPSRLSQGRISNTFALLYPDLLRHQLTQYPLIYLIFSTPVCIAASYLPHPICSSPTPSHPSSIVKHFRSSSPAYPVPPHLLRFSTPVCFAAPHPCHAISSFPTPSSSLPILIPSSHPSLSTSHPRPSLPRRS